MTDQYPGLSKGAFPGADTQDAIADEAILVGSPVIEVAPPAGELEPRVEPNDTQGAVCAGVVVDGDTRGIYDGVAQGAEANAADAAGKAVNLCRNGYCKVQVDGTGTPIAIGDPLTIGTTDGVAIVAVATNYVFGRARQASTLANDFILVDVTREGIL